MRYSVLIMWSAGSSLEVAHIAISISNVVICVCVNPNLAGWDLFAEHVTVEGGWDVVNFGPHLTAIDI